MGLDGEVMAGQTERKYAVWVTGTYRKKGKRQVLIGDDLDLLREYAKEQRVTCEVRTTRTGARMWPMENGRA
jgi:hypothetical protein